NLRAINKIMAYSRLAISSFDVRSQLPFDLVFLLCYIKLTNNAVYAAIKNHEYSIQALVDKLEAILPPSLFVEKGYEGYPRSAAWAIAHLLLAYNYPTRGIAIEPDFDGIPIDDSKFLSFPIQTTKLKLELLLEALTYCRQGQDRYFMEGLNHILSRIDLTENISLDY
ncbi:MAG: hypothetical protein Q4F07_05925, partial [Bacteroidales bacterium]|nr:hypothetical protein [Bacteroidales bacterium]